MVQVITKMHHRANHHGGVFVIGAGGHAKVIVRTLQELGREVKAIFDDDTDLHGSSLFGAPIVGCLAKAHELGHVPGVIAIGDNTRRREIADELDLDWITLVHPRAFVDPMAKLGRGTVVMAGATVQPCAVLGDHVIVNTNASVDHDCRIGDFVHISPGVNLGGGVAIRARACIGLGAVILEGRIIGARQHHWRRSRGDSKHPSRRGGDRSACEADPKPDQTRTLHREHLNVDKTIHKTAECNARWAGCIVPRRCASRDARPRVYLSAPHMSAHERALLLDAFDSNWIAPLGPHVDALEREFAQRIGTPHAVALSSGTASLHLALLLLGVQPGDKVLTSTLTFAATANAIRYAGAEPVFIDSDEKSWNMDPELLAEELEASYRRGETIKTVLVVDVLGQCADYEPILKTCRFYGIPVIEDAAEALGATYQGRQAGTFGDVGCFSFNGNKIITTSGGGMLATGRQDWAERARFLATQARDPAPHYEHSQLGYNYRLSNLLAAVGRGQLQVLTDRVERRRANFEYYRQALSGVPGIRLMPELAQGRSTRWLTCIVVDPDEFGATREDIRLALERENIEARPLWKPMHLQPLYAGFRSVGGAVSERLFERGLCLPSGSALTPEDLGRVMATLLAVPRVPTRSQPPIPVLR